MLEHRYSKHRTKVRLSKLGVKEREKANASRAIHTKLLEQKEDITPNQIYDIMLKTHFIKGLSRRGELYGNKVLSLGVARNFSQGLMVSAASLMYPELTKVLARFLRQYYPTFQFTSIFINKNFPGHLHTDRHNFGKSLMFACGDYTGGELLIQCPRNQLETQMQEHELKFQYVFSFKFHSISELKRHNNTQIRQRCEPSIQTTHEKQMDQVSRSFLTHDISVRYVFSNHILLIHSTTLEHPGTTSKHPSAHASRSFSTP